MKLTEQAQAAINKLEIRLELAKELKFSETWIRSLINDNKDNGPLTTAAALKVIRKELNLTDDKILEESSGVGVGNE